VHYETTKQEQEQAAKDGVAPRTSSSSSAVDALTPILTGPTVTTIETFFLVVEYAIAHPQDYRMVSVKEDKPVERNDDDETSSSSSRPRGRYPFFRGGRGGRGGSSGASFASASNSNRFQSSASSASSAFSRSIQQIASVDRYGRAIPVFNGNRAADSEEDVAEDPWLMRLHFWCMNPAVSFFPMAFKCRSVILTSGTLTPMSLLTSELGTSFATVCISTSFFLLACQLVC
jgi:hypothetical protein